MPQLPGSPGPRGLHGLPNRRTLTVLGLAGLATLFVSFDSSILVLALPAIGRDFRASVPDLTTLGAALELGSLIGLPIAMLADQRGRRRLLAAAVAGFSLAGLASAAAPGLAWLAGARLLAVAFETVAGAVATALVVEEVAADRRGVAVAAITVTAGLGTGLTTLLYPVLAARWRLLYLLTGTGVLAALALIRLLPESRAWTASRPERLPLRVLLEQRWRWRLAVAAGSAALGAVFFSPAGLLVALFGSRQLLLSPAAISAVVVVSGLASAPAFLLGGRLSDHWGRRGLAVTLSVLTAVFAVLTFAGGAPLYWSGNIAWSFLASAGVPVLGAWYGELFPTRARASSEASTAVAASLGGIAGLQLVGAAQPRLGLGPSLMAAGLPALAAAALLAFLPETRGEPLPD